MSEIPIEISIDLFASPFIKFYPNQLTKDDFCCEAFSRLYVFKSVPG